MLEVLSKKITLRKKTNQNKVSQMSFNSPKEDNEVELGSDINHLPPPINFYVQNQNLRKEGES